MMVIEHSDGSTQEGILLSLKCDVIRVAGKGSDDVLEFRLIHNNWVSEDCDVTFPNFAPPRFADRSIRRVCHAAREH